MALEEKGQSEVEMCDFVDQMKCSALALSSLVLRVRPASLPSAVLVVRALSLHAQETAAIMPLPRPLWPFWSRKADSWPFTALMAICLLA